MSRYKTPKPGIETLERLKRWPGLKRRVLQDAVHIYSGEHRAYWRESGHGYTTALAESWTLPLEEAIRQTSHCDPSKKIEFHSLF